MITSSHPWRRLAACAVVGAAFVIALLTLSGGTAAAQALFVPATAADSASASRVAAPKQPQAVRQRLVRVDAGVLTRNVVPAGKSNAGNLAAAQRMKGVVQLDLFPGVSATFQRTGVSAGADGGYVWEGADESGPVHEALLVITDGKVSGRVQLNDRLFSIDPVAGQVHRITEIDPSQFPPEAPPVEGPTTGQRSQQDAAPRDAGENDARANTIIRVLVAYTANAQTEAGGATAIRSEITQAIALANQAYTRGGIGITLQLAGTPMRVVYTESPNIETDLNRLTSGGAPFTTVRSQRTLRRADLVSLFRRNDPLFCGIAWLPGSSPNASMPTPSSSTKNTGFSVMNWVCVDNLSFHHELGHNQGIRHDRYVDPAANNFYNHGYVNLPKRQRTVMAYNNRCQAAGTSCTRINWFSSPTKMAPGSVRLGEADGRSDNTRRLKQTRTAIGNYFPPP